MVKKFYPLFILLSLAASMHAQVVINEFSCANMDGLPDNYGEHEDWIELYNAGTATVNLEGYFLSDNIDNSNKWAIPAGVTIAPGEHLLVFCSDRDEFDGTNLHAGFKITQTKQEYIAFFDPSENLVDAVQILIPNQANHSRGKTTDGGTEWGIFLNPSPGAPNFNPVGEYAAKPELSLAAGFYTGSVSVSITAPAGLTIRFTTDGSEPSGTSPAYSAPLNLTATTVLKAKTFSSDPLTPPSFTEANTYFIDVAHTVPVISIAGEEIPDLMGGNQNAPRGSFEFFKNNALVDEAYGEYNKHGNDSWAYPQRGIDYITKDQMGYTSSIEDEVFHNKSRNNFQRLILKAAANDNYPFIEGAHIRDAYVHVLSQNADMELDERSYEPAILYVNGEYWGVYDIREKVDDPDYTRYYYDQGEKWIDYIKTWGGTWEEYGSRVEWDDLHNYITTNDMAATPNYEYVKERLNVLSLIDYMIINTHVVCKDWLNWNTSWWRGRKPDGDALQWRYSLWDMDASFGHYINYTGIPDVTANADPCYAENLPADFEGHGALITALMANDEFHSLYVNRYADMNNSFFSCDYMLGLLDSMMVRIEPEMQGQIDKWGGTYGGWQDNVQTLIDFINTRCTVINGGIEDCYDVQGPYPVTVKVEPASQPNEVKVNTFIPTVFPWSGEYFSGTTLTFTAAPQPDWELDHWEVQNNSFLPDQYAQAIQFSMTDTMPEVVTAFFRPSIPCAPAINYVVDSTLSSINIAWEGPSNIISYEFGYRKSGTTDDWETVSVVEPGYTAYGLDLCTAYEFRIRTICEFALGTYEEFTISTACLDGTSEPEAGVYEWSIFPNPFDERLSVDFILAQAGDVSLTVMNAAGQVVMRQMLGYAFAGQQRVELEEARGWSDGVYFVQLTTAEGSVVRKVVKG